MQFGQGRTFENAEPREVVDFLNSRDLKTFELQPDRLHIANDGRGLFLQFTNGKVHQYRLRESFYLKLLKWFSFPPGHMRRLNIDTVTSILNDFLLSIASPSVTVKIENGDALTIRSDRYSEMTDLRLIELCEPIGTATISRNDFFIRLYSHERFRTDIKPGDTIGFGYNVLNSETGFRALSVYHYVLRYLCTNGAIAFVGSKDERIHFGYSPDEMWEFVSKKFQEGGSRTELIAQLKASMREPAAVHVKIARQYLRPVIGWRDAEALLEELPQDGTRYDLINLITDRAKQHNLGDRLRLESLGGMLMTAQNQTTLTQKEEVQ